MDLHYDIYLTKAAKLYNFISLTTKHVNADFAYEYVDAMEDMGIPSNLAKSLSFSQKFVVKLQEEMIRTRSEVIETPTTAKEA